MSLTFPSAQAERKVTTKLSPEVLREAPLLQFFAAVPYQALVRFGKWDEILQEPPPDYDGPLVTGLWHFPRGTAYSAKQRFEKAEAELQALCKLATDPKVAEIALWSPNSIDKLLSIADLVLEADMASHKGEYDHAVGLLDKAVRLDDGLNDIEPPNGGVPIRHLLGAVLLEGGRPKEAETVYWEDLRRNPENSWALLGLGQALLRQNKNEQAMVIGQRFRRAWPEADVQLVATRF